MAELDAVEAGVPVLGICYGQQVMMDMLGGKVEGGGNMKTIAIVAAVIIVLLLLFQIF